jgi:hypothetical protein
VSQATHARVLLPDLFRGAPWTEEKMKTLEYVTCPV